MEQQQRDSERTRHMYIDTSMKSRRTACRKELMLHSLKSRSATASHSQHVLGNLPKMHNKKALSNNCILNRSGTQDQQTVLGYPNMNFYSALVYKTHSSYLKGACFMQK